LATFGAGGLPHQNESAPPVAMEFILRSFIGDNANLTSIEELLRRLVTRLNTFPPSKHAAMIDIAGCLPVDDNWYPIVYQIGNCDDPNIEEPKIRPFRAFFTSL
jgi:hypothetical protein